MSGLVDISCGVPQGTISGPKLFTILIKGVKCPMVLNVKFVDDKTLIHSYSGNSTQFLQNVLNIENEETIKDKMIINEAKCNIINFNFSGKNSPPQNLQLNNKNISSVERIKLLGLILTNDLRWRENTSEIIKKVNTRFYQLCNLKKFGASTDILLTTWKTLLRPLTEYAAPVWHSSLLDGDDQLLENLQKKALGLILGNTYINHKRYYNVKGKPTSYEDALETYDLVPLKVRRDELTRKFAHQTFNDPMHRDFFEVAPDSRPNTRFKPRVIEHQGRSFRFLNSAIQSFSREINSRSQQS